MCATPYTQDITIFETVHTLRVQRSYATNYEYPKKIGGIVPESPPSRPSLL